MLAFRDDWPAFLAEGQPDEEQELLRRHERTGRPLGDRPFLMRLEELTGRTLARRKPGPPSGRT